MRDCRNNGLRATGGTSLYLFDETKRKRRRSHHGSRTNAVIRLCNDVFLLVKTARAEGIVSSRIYHSLATGVAVARVTARCVELNKDGLSSDGRDFDYGGRAVYLESRRIPLLGKPCVMVAVRYVRTGSWSEAMFVRTGER